MENKFKYVNQGDDLVKLPRNGLSSFRNTLINPLGTSDLSPNLRISCTFSKFELKELQV